MSNIMGSSKVFMEVGEDKVAVVTINNPPVNSLANSVYNGLWKCFKEVQETDDIKAAIITGSRGKFCGGADIRSFQKRQNAEEGEKSILTPLNIINKIIEACKKPVVAAMEGFALGGGLELAMACHARVATNGTELGLPELQLGIIPGLGGTQRLPRLVGLEKALDMLLTSRSICAEEAKAYGLVDVVTGSSNLIDMARMQALKMVGLEQSWNISLQRMDKIGNMDEALATLKRARASAKRKFRNVSYPFLCLDVIEEGLRNGGEAGTELENKVFRKLVKTFEARALMHIFFAQRSSFKVFDVTNLGVRVHRPIRRAAIIGGGLMGSGIATAFVANKIPVILKDINLTVLEGSIKMIEGNLENLVRKGKMTELQAKDSLALVKITDTYCDFGNLDVVVESVYEDVSLKQHIFHELESVCSANCILASNTSSIDVGTIGAKISRPDGIVGAHFFSPAHVMQLLEIVQTDQTSSQTVLDLLALARTLKKIPLVVKNVPGFAVNRLFVPYLMFATLLVDLGLDPYHIDVVVKEFGMPMGPFRVADFTGIKTFHVVSQGFFRRSPHSFYISPLISLLLKDNRQGNVTKRGFYDYEGVGDGAKTPELKNYVKTSRQIAQVKGAQINTQNISDAEIVEMIFLGVANEACKIMEENVVTGPTALDLASVFGMGFPSYRGGIIFWADGLGPVYILNQLKKWWQCYGDVYKPSILLEECAASNRPLGRVLTNPAKL